MWVGGRRTHLNKFYWVRSTDTANPSNVGALIPTTEDYWVAGEPNGPGKPSVNNQLNEQTSNLVLPTILSKNKEKKDY